MDLFRRMFNFSFFNYYVFEIPLWIYLIIFIMVFVGSVIDALAGGGALITIPTYLICGLPPHLAIGTNKFNSTLGTIISTITYYRKGYVENRLILPIVVVTIIGASLGSFSVLWVSSEFLKYFMMALLPLILILMLRKKEYKQSDHVHIHGVKKWLKLLGTVFGIGFYDGFYGAGTGIFLVLAFTYLLQMNVYQSAGNAKISNLASNSAALIVFIISGYINYPMAIVATVSAILGHLVGSSLLVRKGVTLVKPTIIVAIIALFISTLLELF